MNARLASLGALGAALILNVSVPMLAATQAPSPVYQPEPRYPYDLRRNEIEGHVTVAFTVTAKGDVERATVVSSTDQAFERSTLHAIRLWRFVPVKKDGVAVSTTVLETVNFRLPYLHAANAAAIAGAGSPGGSPSKVAVNR
jgi:TonB family protein